MRQYLYIKNNVTRTCTLLTFGAVDQTVFLPSQCDGCNFLLPNYMYKLVNLLICETELTVFFQLCYRQIKVTYQTVIRFMTFIPYFIVNPLQSHFNVEANSNQKLSLYTLFFYKNNEAQIYPKIKNNVKTIQVGIWNHNSIIFYYFIYLPVHPTLRNRRFMGEEVTDHNIFFIIFLKLDVSSAEILQMLRSIEFPLCFIRLDDHKLDIFGIF